MKQLEEFKNLKQNAISAISILIAVIFSIVSITFAWYIQNSVVNATVSGMQATLTQKQSMEINELADPEKKVDQISLTISSPVYCRPVLNNEKTSITGWKQRSISTLTDYDGVLTEICYKNDYSLVLYNEIDLEKNFDLVLTPSVNGSTTELGGICFAISAYEQNTTSIDNLCFYSVQNNDIEDKLTYTVNASGEEQTIFEFSVFVWADVNASESLKAEEIAFSLQFNFAEENENA